MTKTAERNLIVGLDIGTTKVAVLVGEVLPDGEINIIGLGTHSARGMDKDIEVDGGINLDNVDTVIKAGANVIVAGSAVFRGSIESNVRGFLDRM